MVARRDLNAPPARQLADIVAGLRDQQAQQKTGAAGVKDLGAAGDVVWTRPDATPVSVREVDAELVDAVGRIEDAEQTSEGLAQRVTDAETLIGTVAGDLDVMESETLPNAVSSLEAADQAARDDLTALDGKLVTAQTDLDAAEASLAQLGTDLVAESAAREALDASVRADLGTLDDKLVTAFPGGVFDVSAELAQTIRNSVVQYAVGTSETTAPITGWATTTPVRAAGEFIWFRTVITYADATTSTSSPALLTGNAGAPGPKGEDGTGVTILGSFDTAAELPASGTDGDAYLVAGDLYVWNSIAGDWENVGTIQGPAGAPGVPGAPGSPGPAGIGVASVTPYYQRLASGSTAPAKPTAVTPTGWASTEPVWQASTELWRTERIVYSDATYAYTDVTRVAVFAGIDAAMTAANGKNKVTYTDLADASKPGPAPAVDNTRAAGDIHRNRRASTGEIWAEYQWTGTQWKAVSFGDGVLTSLDVGKLSAGTATIGTGVIDKLWVDGIMAKSVATTSITVSASNLLPDPNGNTATGREAYANLGFVWDPSVTGWTRTPPAATNQTKPNAGGDYTSYPLEGGRVYRLSFEAYVAGGTGDARYAIYYTRRDGTTAFVGDQIEAGYDTAVYTPVPANTWTKVNRAWIAPADAVMGGFALQVNNVSAGATRVSIRKPYAGVMHSGVHIENGAITADKVQAESVAGAVGKFIALSTDQLTAGTASIGSAVAQRFWADIATFNSITADSVVVGGVDGAAIADGAVGAVKIEDGAVTTPKLLVTEDMSAAIVNAMSVNAKQLVVTEEAVLNHATLIGQTVVDDINVQGKLIGQDGVFTGTVDFENVNVTNELLASKISGEHLYGTTVEGGEFVTTPGAEGQRFLISDSAYVYPTDGYTTPGLRFEDPAKGYIYPPGLGMVGGTMRLSGGRTSQGYTSGEIRDRLVLFNSVPDPALPARDRITSTLRASDAGVSQQVLGAEDGQQYRVSASPPTYIDGTESFPGTAEMLAARGASEARAIVSPGSADMVVRSGGQVDSRIRADGTEAYIHTRAGGKGRYLSVDATGIWVKVERNDGTGLWDHYNLEQTANDSGWKTFSMNSAVIQANSPGYRIKGGVVWLRGTLTLASNWSSGWTTLGVLPAGARPSTNMQRPGASQATAGIVLEVTTAGTLQMYLPTSMPGSTTIQMAPMFYPLG